MATEIKSIKNILLIRDDLREVEHTLASMEQDRLADHVAIVSNGPEALDYLYRRGRFEGRAGGNPILLLLDFATPQAKGFEALEIIKADEYLKIIPVVMLSSACETPDFGGQYEHRVNAFVAKPVDFLGFMKAIGRLRLFWAAVDEPPPPVLGKRDRPTLGQVKGRTPNGSAEHSAIHFMQ